MFIRDFEKFAYRRKQHGYSFYYQYWREVLFDYACKIIDNHIDTYVGTKKYETPNIYFLLQYRLVEMKKKVGKELKQQERINKPQKPRDRYEDFAEDDANKVIPIDPNEYNEFLSEQAEKKRKIANF